MKHFIFAFLVTISLNSSAQGLEGLELGFDGSFGASTFGGAFGLGPKVGFVMNENLVLGPTFRIQRTWSKNIGSVNTYSHTIYGGGIFLHARYKNVIFGGVEFEMIQSRNYEENKLNEQIWVPTAFICAGFSKEFAEIVRINVGLYYDVVNSKNSPFRNSYMLPIKNAQTGAIQGYAPLLYRISFYFPLFKEAFAKKNGSSEEEIIEDEPEETW